MKWNNLSINSPKDEKKGEIYLIKYLQGKHIYPVKVITFKKLKEELMDMERDDIADNELVLKYIDHNGWDRILSQWKGNKFNNHYEDTFWKKITTNEMMAYL